MHNTPDTTPYSLHWVPAIESTGTRKPGDRVPLDIVCTSRSQLKRKCIDMTPRFLLLAVLTGSLSACAQLPWSNAGDSPAELTPQHQANHPGSDNTMKDQTPLDATESAATSPLEPASFIEYNGNSILANVISTGCTSSADFHIEYTMVENQCQISIVRDKPDFCRRAPFTKQVQVDWNLPAECANTPLVLTNPPLDESQDERNAITR